MHKLMASIAALAACLGGSSAAMAGTATAASKATLTVVNNCSIEGANVNLGSYKSNDTVRQVASVLGYQDSADSVLKQGSNGIGTVSMGSVSCENGVIYTIEMTAPGTTVGDPKLTLGNNKSLYLFTVIKKIGDTVMLDAYDIYKGFGKGANPHWSKNFATGAPGATGNGKVQPIMGNVILYLYQTATADGYLGADDQLGNSGTYSTSWTSTVKF